MRPIRHDVATSELRETVAKLLGRQMRLATIAAHDEGERIRLVYVLLSRDATQCVEVVVRIEAATPRVPSLYDLSFSAGRLERELHDQFGVLSEGHPARRALVRHAHWPEDWHPMRRGAGPRPQLAEDVAAFPFTPVSGPGVYEIPVGPVHAGLIEPGHFRFSVVGERILKMTPRLWFVHRGVERLAEGRDVEEVLELSTRVSGDSAVAHSLAFSMAVEAARGLEIPDSALEARSILLELERVANHIADVGAMCNDVGFSVAHARALVLRERLARHMEDLTGHRFARGSIGPGRGSLLAPVDTRLVREVAQGLEDVVGLALSHSVVRERFTGTSVVGVEDARRLDTLGVVARASGHDVDARASHPFDGPRRTILQERGDVLGRFLQRVEEARDSLAWLLGGEGAHHASPIDAPEPDGSGVGVVEAWRGTLVHRVELREGRVVRWRIADPSFFNWPALAVALTDTIVPDFPLTNKSFNLSYAGNDL